MNAPFDPCRVVTWKDFPAKVRHPKNKPPHPIQIDKGVPYSTGCKYDNSVLDIDVQNGTGTSDAFFTMVTWGTGFHLADYKAPKWTHTTIAGKPAVTRKTLNNGAPQCAAIAWLKRGAVGVITTDGRFKSDTCTLSQHLATLVANRTG